MSCTADFELGELLLWVRRETVANRQGREHGTRGVSIVRSRYRAMTSEDIAQTPRIVTNT
jgi:hypothetical protein